MSVALAAPGVRLDSDTLIAMRTLALTDRSPETLAALPGGYATRRKGQGLELADIRPYVAGDDLRHLDRGATARTGRLHIRQFQEERDRVSLLVADFRPAMLWGLRRAFRSVAAAEVLSLLGWQSVEGGGRVGLLAVTAGAPVIVAPRGRSRGMLDVIGGLVAAHEQAMGLAADGAGDPPLDQALLQAERIVPRGAELLIASGFDTLGPSFTARLDDLSRRRHPRLFAIRTGGTLPRGRYPVRMPDGRFLRLQAYGDAQGGDMPSEEIAGRVAHLITASDPPEATARRLTHPSQGMV